MQHSIHTKIIPMIEYVWWMISSYCLLLNSSLNQTARRCWCVVRAAPPAAEQNCDHTEQISLTGRPSAVNVDIWFHLQPLVLSACSRWPRFTCSRLVCCSTSVTKHSVRSIDCNLWVNQWSQLGLIISPSFHQFQLVCRLKLDQTDSNWLIQTQPAVFITNDTVDHLVDLMTSRFSVVNWQDGLITLL